MFFILFSSYSWSQTLGTEGAAPVDAAKGQMGSAKSAVESLKSLEASQAKLKSANESCSKAADAAKNACVESYSPIIKAAMAAMMSAIQSQQGASGSNGNCSQANKSQEQGKKGMNDFAKDCTAKKTACEKACEKAEESATSVGSSTCKTDAAKLSSPQKEQMLTLCKQAAEKTKSAVDSGKSSCAGLGKNASAGAAAALEMLTGLMNSAACKKETGDEACDKNPNQEKCKLDCNDAKNAANVKCICEKNPRAAGCGGDTSIANDNNQSNDKAIPQGGSPSSDQQVNSDDNSSDSSSGPKSSGSGNFGSGAGAANGNMSAKGKDSKAEEKAKAKEPSVLAGDIGGGASATTAGSAPSDGEPNGKYAAILAKEKSRDPASSLKNEITGGFGLSNWEKVNNGYRTKADSLLLRK